MNKTLANVLANAKAYAALIGSVATALLGITAGNSQIGAVLTVVLAVCTAVATWTVPNSAPVPVKTQAGEVSLLTVLLGVVLVLVVLLLLGHPVHVG
jgi:hypothetical protein